MKTKAQTSFVISAKLISAFVFVTQLVQSLFVLNPKSQASIVCFCDWLVCVDLVGNPDVSVLGSFLTSVVGS